MALKGKTISCGTCDKEFYRQLSTANGKFCSYDCYNTYQRRNRVDRKCLNCDADFKVAPSRLKHEAASFCTHKCSTDYNHRLKQSGDGPIVSTKVATKRKVEAKKQKYKMAHADAIFSKYIRARDGKCLRCGKTETLQCSHILPRTMKVIRCDPDNAITLCYACHIHWWHKQPIAAARWFEETWPGRYDRLLVKSQNLGTKTDWAEIYARFKAALSEII